MPLRVVLTGGPGGGKTTAADLYRRELGPAVTVVPEAATLLYAGGFPRPIDPAARRAAQLAIYHVQRGLEDIQAVREPERILLCDRGTLDGAAYWPGEPAGFFAAVDSSAEAELARYDAVLFFESAAVGGLHADSSNPWRVESMVEAAALDARLRAIWERHPRFALVRHEDSFLAKIASGLTALHAILAAPRGPS
jgi:predicted ATPase